MTDIESAVPDASSTQPSVEETIDLDLAVQLAEKTLNAPAQESSVLDQAVAMAEATLAEPKSDPGPMDLDEAVHMAEESMNVDDLDRAVQMAEGSLRTEQDTEQASTALNLDNIGEAESGVFQQKDPEVVIEMENPDIPSADEAGSGIWATLDSLTGMLGFGGKEEAIPEEVNDEGGGLFGGLDGIMSSFNLSTKKEATTEEEVPLEEPPGESWVSGLMSDLDNAISGISFGGKGELEQVPVDGDKPADEPKETEEGGPLESILSSFNNIWSPSDEPDMEKPEEEHTADRFVRRIREIEHRLKSIPDMKYAITASYCIIFDLLDRLYTFLPLVNDLLMTHFARSSLGLNWDMDLGVERQVLADLDKLDELIDAIFDFVERRGRHTSKGSDDVSAAMNYRAEVMMELRQMHFELREKRVLMAGDEETDLEPSVHVRNHIPLSFKFAGGEWGRSVEVDEAVELTLALENSLKNIRIVALHGPAGSGATFFACRIAHHIQEIDFNEAGGYLWLRGSTDAPMDQLDAMAAIISQFSPGEKLPTLKVDIEDAYDLVFKGRRMVLVLDDVANLEQLAALLPRRGDTVVITTSTEPLGLANENNSIGIAAIYTSRIQSLSSLEATAALAAVLPAPEVDLPPRLAITNPDFDPQKVQDSPTPVDPSIIQERAMATDASHQAFVLKCTELAARCAHSPLVMHAVVALIQSSTKSVETVTENLPEAGQEAGESDEVVAAIAERAMRTLDIVLDLVVANLSSSAKCLIKMLLELYSDGIFSYNNVFSILHDDCDNQTIANAAGTMDELQRCGLVWFNTETYCYAFHPNIHRYFMRKSDGFAADIEFAVERQQVFVENLLKHASTMDRVSPELEIDAIVQVQANIADIDAVFSRWARDKNYSRIHQCLKGTFGLLAKAVSPVMLIRWYEPHLDEAMKRKDMGSTLACDALAHAYCAVGRVEEAEDMLRRSLEIRTRVLGPFNMLVAISVNAIARLFIRIGRIEEAYPLYEQALRIRVDKVGEYHPDVASSLNDIGSVYLRDGKWSDAANMFRAALAISVKSVGPGHSLYKGIRANLAICGENEDGPGFNNPSSVTSPSAAEARSKKRFEDADETQKLRRKSAMPHVTFNQQEKIEGSDCSIL